MRRWIVPRHRCTVPEIPANAPAAPQTLRYLVHTLSHPGHTSSPRQGLLRVSSHRKSATPCPLLEASDETAVTQGTLKSAAHLDQMESPPLLACRPKPSVKDFRSGDTNLESLHRATVGFSASSGEHGVNANSLSRGRVKRGINDGASRRLPQWQIGWLCPSIQQFSRPQRRLDKKTWDHAGTCLILLTPRRALRDHSGIYQSTRSIWRVIMIRDSHHILR